jgi:hypothetical protein
LLTSFLAGCAATRVEVETLPPELRGSYAIFETRCSKCHSIARPLNARIDDMGHWRRYVARMRRMPGSGINPEDAVQILRFLEYYTHVVRGVRAQEDQEATATADARDGTATAGGTIEEGDTTHE